MVRWLNNNMKDIIYTKSLILRDYQETDLEPLFRIQSDAKTMRYTYHASSRKDSEHRFLAYATLKAQLGYAPWTVLLPNEDGRIIGWGDLNIDPFDPGWGCELLGRDYVTELVRASLTEGSKMHRLELIKAFAHPENEASLRLEDNSCRIHE